MGFSRHKYWSGLPFPSPECLPNPGIKPASLASPALTGRFFTTSATWEAHDATGEKQISSLPDLTVSPKSVYTKKEPWEVGTIKISIFEMVTLK